MCLKDVVVQKSTQGKPLECDETEATRLSLPTFPTKPVV